MVRCGAGTGPHYQRRSACGLAGRGRARRDSRATCSSTARDVEQLETTVENRAGASAPKSAALAVDPRITNSEGASFDSHLGRRVFANSRGFAGEYRTSCCSLSVVPVAREGDSMERDYWCRIGARFRRPGSRRAGRPHRRRTRPAPAWVARKVPTQKVPVIFEPRTARTLLGDIFDAVNGDSIYRHASFLAGKLGEKIASENVTVIDDGTMPGLFGTLALRRRRRGLAPHGGDRARRAEELSAEHLHGAQAGPEDHRQRVARAHGERRRRPRELFPRAGRKPRRRSSPEFRMGFT